MLIKLTQSDGGTLWVNPAHVVSLKADEGDRAVITFVNGETATLRGVLNAVASKLNAG